MDLIDTVAYRAYLCVVKDQEDFHLDTLTEDLALFNELFIELSGAELDEVFSSQMVLSSDGEERWAFGEELRARLFLDKESEILYLLFPGTSQLVDVKNDLQIGANLIGDRYVEGTQLVELIKPEYLNRIVVTGHSLGGGIAAYCAVTSTHQLRVVAFDPAGLNSKMLTGIDELPHLLHLLPFPLPFENLSVKFQNEEHFRHDLVDWYYVSGSWLAALNPVLKLSSIGHVWELLPDPEHPGVLPHQTHDIWHISHGLQYLYQTNEEWREREFQLSRNMASF